MWGYRTYTDRNGVVVTDCNGIRHSPGNICPQCGAKMPYRKESDYPTSCNACTASDPRSHPNFRQHGDY